MRVVIYAARDDRTFDVDLETAIFDRNVDQDITTCRVRDGKDTSWNDYEPIALVEVNGAETVAGELCISGRPHSALELLRSGTSAYLGTIVTRLDDGEHGELEPEPAEE